MFGKKKPSKQVRRHSLPPGEEAYAFRRSRTLTGSASSKVNSSAEPRSQLKTDRLKVHELHQQRKHILRLLITTGLIVAGLLYLYTSHIGIINIAYPQAAQGITQPTTNEYSRTIKTYINEHPFEQFSFSVNSLTLQHYMQEKHSEISSVRAGTSDFGSEAEFNISLRKPILVWKAPTGEFFVDNTGTAFAKNYFNVAPVPITDRSGVSPDTNGVVASNRFIRFLGQTVAAVNAGGKGAVVSVIIPASTREIDLRLQGRDYDIKTHIDRDPNQQAEDIINALNYFDSKKIKPQYIDVRVAGSAFYK